MIKKIWHKFILLCFSWHLSGMDFKIIRVKGWNLFLVDDKSGQRKTISFG